MQMKRSICYKTILFVILFCIPGSISFNQTRKEAKGEFPGKADMYKSKRNALEYLQDSLTIRKFGLISDSIWSFAELGMQEFRSSAILIRTLEDEGFSIERNVAGMPTCFVATWGEGKPVIGILGEYDALPLLSQKALIPTQEPLAEGAPGHGCGHNMMGTAGIAAAIAVKRSMEANRIAGTVRFFGSPAEETLISRPYMVREGVFKDVDAVIDNHASSNLTTGYGVNGTAVLSVIFTFRGRTSHAAAAPWSGRSALDAVELMNVAANYLREHLERTSSLHYIITEAGQAPNIVPDRASVWYYIRNTDDRLEDMFRRVVDCARGAALASGTTLDSVTVISGIHQKHANKGLAEAIQGNIELIGLPEWTAGENTFAKSLQKGLGSKEVGFPVKLSPFERPSGIETGGASTDVGDVSLIAPTATLNFPGLVPGITGHHWSTVACSFGTASWKGLITGAEVMAATTIDLLTKPELLDAVRAEFEDYSKSHPYKSFLPEGNIPPLDLNRELMEKYLGAPLKHSIPE